MTLIKKHISLLLSSDEANGAVNKTEDGSEFSVNLGDEGIYIPSNALSCDLWVQDAEYFFTFPNILTGTNDLLTITYDDGINPLYTMNLVVPQGLYSINDLNSTLQVLQFNSVAYPEVSPLVEVLGDDATQRVLLRYNYPGVRVDLTGSQTFRDIIGYDSGLYPLAGPSTANTFSTGQNVAAFNTLKYVLISCDLCDNGIQNNTVYDFYVCRSLIDRSVGEQVTYVPPLRLNLPANNLIGKKLSRTRVKLLDDKGQDVNTAGETYSIHIGLEYSLIIDD